MPTRSRARPATGRRAAALIGRQVTVLDAHGDFGQAVGDDEVWLVRHATDVLHPGDTVRVVRHRLDHLVVLGTTS